MTKRLSSPYQRRVMARLRAGEHLRWNWAQGAYQLSGGGVVVLGVTFRSLKRAGLIRPTGDIWVATEKGGADAT